MEKSREKAREDSEDLPLHRKLTMGSNATKGDVVTSCRRGSRVIQIENQETPTYQKKIG